MEVVGETSNRYCLCYRLNDNGQIPRCNTIPLMDGAYENSPLFSKILSKGESINGVD